MASYQHLGQYINSAVLVNPRSIIISAYALCGFAHIASLAIFMGGISALVPSRSKDLAVLGFRSLLAATLACLMTGAIAGIFITPTSNQLIGFWYSAYDEIQRYPSLGFRSSRHIPGLFTFR